MDIVSKAGDAMGISIPRSILYRIAIIGNGYPHFSHLVGKYLLQEAVRSNLSDISPETYKAGILQAVAGSHEELRLSYEKAVQRQDDVYKHLLWALADMDTVDVRIDEWVSHYYEIAKRQTWKVVEEDTLRERIQRLGQEPYGSIVANPSIRYGASTTRYRYKRFSSTLMKSHIRLIAESENVELGSSVGL